MFDNYRRLSICCSEEVGAFNCAVTSMLADTVLFGRQCLHMWTDTWRLAKRRGLFDNQFIRMQLARMASYVGACGPAMDFFMDPRSMAVEMSNVYAFVRRDTSRDLLNRTVEITQGENLSAERSLFDRNPYSTVGNLISYVRTTMTNPNTFWNESSVLMALNWVADTTQRIAAWRQAGMPQRAFKKLLRELQKLEQVQIKEKNRFWDVVEGMPPGKARERVISLWSVAPTKVIYA
jgi:hypothetical protein